MGCGKHKVASGFKHNNSSYLQHQPQLISTFHVLLVVHPEEFDDIGVVRKSLEDVVLRFDLLIDILKGKDTQSVYQPCFSILLKRYKKGQERQKT